MLGRPLFTGLVRKPETGMFFSALGWMQDIFNVNDNCKASWHIMQIRVQEM